MVARGQGPLRSPPAVFPEPGRQGDPPPAGRSGRAPVVRPSGHGAGALLSAPRRLTASRGSSLAALGLLLPKLGQRPRWPESMGPRAAYSTLDRPRATSRVNRGVRTPRIGTRWQGTEGALWSVP